MRIAMVAGEASGDLLASHLIRALRERLPNAEFVGIGGPKMQAEGLKVWWPSEKLAVRGYVEVLRHYREISGIRKALLKRLLQEKPDVFIGVDAPDFNLWLEAQLKRAGIKTIHYISPSIWAWRGSRIKRIAQSVSHILCLFPFEPILYEKVKVPATFVGHPLADEFPLESARAQARERLGLDDQTQVFALLPGSRQSELRYMADLFAQTAKKLHSEFPQARFLVPLITRETRTLFEHALWRQEATQLPIQLLFGHSHDALAACDVALVASGTATLEAAMLKAPHVITYRMSQMSWCIMKRMAYQPWVGLPNILAKQFLVPELLQEDATSDNLAQALSNLMRDRNVQTQLRARFLEIHQQLRQDSARKAAEVVASFLPNATRGCVVAPSASAEVSA